MRKLCILFVALISVVAASAQDSIVVKKDPRLDVLTSKQAAANKRNGMMSPNGKYKGFRVLVVTTRDRTKAQEVKADLLTRYPDQKVYSAYTQPTFKVLIGDFIKKEEAEAFRKLVAKHYTDGVFVVASEIEYTPPDEEETIID